MAAPERLLVGVVIKPHGIRGELVVEPHTDSPDRFAAGSVLHAGDRTLTVARSRPHQGRLLVVFDEVVDRNDAETLRSAALTIAATEASPLPEWSFYPHELQGAAVVDAGGRDLGTLLRVEENPANDLWVVEHDGREVLVPAVRAFVVSVDVTAKRIVLDPPEGLF